jgi:hypothetical protein
MIEPLKVEIFNDSNESCRASTNTVKERNKLRHLCHLNFSSSWDSNNKTYGDCADNPPEVMKWKVMAYLFTT